MDSPRMIPSDAKAIGDTTTIVIIGAGPAGLAALKAVLDTPQFKSGRWVPIVFESRSDVGGVWLPGAPSGPDTPPPTPLYNSLTTNLPHPLMAYEGIPFPPSTPVFPKAHVVHSYLASFATRFNLRPYIRFNSPVIDVAYHPPSPSTAQRAKGKLWTVTASSSITTPADLVIICTGHYAVPRYPDPQTTLGLSAWLSQEKATHSMWYRHPSPIESSTSRTILIVGAGPSGQDLTADHLAAGYTVIHSTTTPPPTSATPNERLKPRPRVSRYESVESGTVVFEDGTSESDISHCILATGYDYSYPFLSKHPLLEELAFPPPIPPLPSHLYNSGYSVFPLAQHIWPLRIASQSAESRSTSAIADQALAPNMNDTGLPAPPNLTLAFLGLLTRVSPLPLVQIQARAVLAAFAHQEVLGDFPTRETQEIVDRYHKLSDTYKGVVEEVYKGWHRFEPLDQYDYRDRLARLSMSSIFPGEPVVVPQWHKEMLPKSMVLRRTWLALEKSGEAESWVRGVGEGEDPDGEWEDLLRRLVEKGEKEYGFSLGNSPLNL